MRRCDCDPGWTTGAGQDLSAFAYCNALVAPPPPPGTSIADGPGVCVTTYYAREQRTEHYICIAITMHTGFKIGSKRPCKCCGTLNTTQQYSHITPLVTFAAANGTTASARTGIGLLFNGSMPTVTGWVVIFVAVLLCLALLTWFLCWRRGRIGFCCGRTRSQRTRAEVPAADKLSYSTKCACSC
jgi:hypothetical protein